MSVYIITDRAAGLAKIGYSQTPKKRLTMLRTSSAADLRLEAVIPGDAAITHKELLDILPAIQAARRALEALEQRAARLAA